MGDFKTMKIESSNVMSPINEIDTGSSTVKRMELLQIAMAIEALANCPPSTIVQISQAAIDRLAQDVGGL
jgi:hypothetical protein